MPFLNLVVEKTFRLVGMGSISLYLAFDQNLTMLGSYGVSLGIIAIAAAVATMNLNQLIIVKNRNRFQTLLISRAVLELTMPMASIAAAILYWMLFPGDIIGGTIVLVAIILKRYEIDKAYLVGEKFEKDIVKVELIVQLLVFLMRVIAIIKDNKYIFIGTLAVESMMYMWFYGEEIKRKAGDNSLKVSLILARRIRIMKFCLPLAISTIVIALYVRLDQLMLAYFTDMSQVGQYVLYVQFLGVMYIPTNALVQLFARDGLAVKTAALKKIMIITLLCVSFFTATILVFFLISIFFDVKKYYIFSDLALFLSLIIPVGVGSLISQYMIVKNCRHWVTKRAVINLSLNFAANSIMIPNFGIFGAIISSVISYWIALILIDAKFLWRYYVK